MSGLAGVGVRDDGEGAPRLHLLLHVHHSDGRLARSRGWPTLPEISSIIFMHVICFD